MSQHSELPLDTDDWTKEHVRQWITQELKIDAKYSDILYNQDVTGAFLKPMDKTDLKDMGITFGPAHHIITKFSERNKLARKSTSPTAGPRLNQPCKGENQGEAIPKQKKAEQSKSHDERIHEPTQALTDTTEKADANEKQLGKAEIQTFESKQFAGDELAMPTCMSYPFDAFHDSKRYIQHQLLTPESGPSNLIDPVHEFKLFTNTGKATEKDAKMKFCNEAFRFAAACMNSRTNGTIHFGVSDKPHGDILGVEIESKQSIIDCFNQMIKQYFETKQVEKAKLCIRHPRFVDVLNQDNTTSNRVVIEVDVVPKYSICKSELFSTYQQNFTEAKQEWKKSKDTSFFVRDGASSKDLLANVRQNDADYKSHVANLKLLDEIRQMAEEETRARQRKKEEEGPKLVSLITGNRDILDNSYYKWYMLVANKCHPSQIKHLDFLKEIRLFAVFEFDPESEINGVCKSYREKRVANLHFPNLFQDMDCSTAEKIEKLKLYKQTSWIFCNGRTELNSKEYQPLPPMEWQKKRAAEVRKLISFFSRKDIMERGKFLVVFLLLSVVENPADPIIETFSTFYQELNGTQDILCICESEQTCQRWKDLQARFVGAAEMEARCISNLSFEEINGTILKLKSVRQSSHRFLPSHGLSSTILHKKEEDSMTTLGILCENECEDTDIEKDISQFHAFKISQEAHFYRGGKVSWWNFFFSSKNYSGPFIKRGCYEKLEKLIMSWSQFKKQICVKIINLYHHPGCGGSTLAMHVLWNLKNKFRCAVLQNKAADFTDIGRQISHLATYGFNKQSDYFSVLLLVDDFEEDEHVHYLQNSIQTAVAEKYIRFERPVVIILNCMRSQNPEVSSKNYCTNSVALTNVLSLQEQRAFEDKLKEIEKQHQRPENFYSFMIMKSNFDNKYIENMVRNTLKGLNKDSHEAQLISYLALLNSFVKDSTISVSQCEEFLGITAKQTFYGPETLEDKMGPYFSILICTEEEEVGRYLGLRVIHPLIANQCLEELKQTYHLNKSTVILHLLKRANVFYDFGIGRDRFLQNMQYMLITRQRKEHGDDTDTLFSPLIEAIQDEEGNSEVENVLVEGTNRFHQNPFILQALARHLYIREKEFERATEVAIKAKKIAPDNSFLSDTLGQIYKTQLKCWMDENAKKETVTVDELKFLLDTAVSAANAFMECQEQSLKKETVRDEWESQRNKRKYGMYNTAGYLGHIEVCLYTVNVLELVPRFSQIDGLSKTHMLQFLSKNCDVPRDTMDKCDEEFNIALSEYSYFLNNLKSNLKRAFDFFDDYFVHFKPRNMLKESAESKMHKKVQECFRKYKWIFCKLDHSLLGNKPVKSKLSTALQSEQYRADLEACKADRFAGLLEYLNRHEKEKDKMEDIVKTYDFLLQHNTSNTSLRDKQNFILANIVLSCIKPKSNQLCLVKTLKEYLRQVLKQVGLDHRHSEPYFLALLLFWPPTQHQLDDDSRLMEKYVSAMKHCFRGRYHHMCSTKQPISHFYLGNSKDLKRLVHKGKIDQFFSNMPAQDVYSRWQTGEIWKDKNVAELLLRLTGRTENDLVYVECGADDKIKIPVRPVYLGQLRSGRSIERVSFYLGFSIEGLIAYDIESF